MRRLIALMVLAPCLAYAVPISRPSYNTPDPSQPSVAGSVTMGLDANTVLHKGPSPNNDGNFVQYCEEAIVQNGPAWDVNDLVLDNVTFLCTTAPGAITSNGWGIAALQSAGQFVRSSTTGLLATAVYRNCKFYNLPRDQWATAGVVDGGGNVHLTDWLGLQAIDPSTGVLLTQNHKPGPGYDLGFVNIAAGQGIVVDALELETRIVAGAAVGVQVTQMFALDIKGNALTSPVWTLPGNQNNTGAFSIDAGTGIVRVAQAGLPNGLRWVYATCTGNDTATVPASQTYGKYIAVIVGTGHVPGLATAGGAVQAP